jgi:hypothetical protein
VRFPGTGVKGVFTVQCCFFHGFVYREKKKTNVSVKRIFVAASYSSSNFLLMDNNLLFIFKTEDIKRLVDSGSDFIVIRSFLESVVLNDGRKAGALRVYADAVNREEEKAMVSVEGCPRPPCDTNGEIK